MEPRRYFLYLVFGEEKYWYEALYSITSLLKNGNLSTNNGIVVITEQSEFFKTRIDSPLITYITISEKVLDEWTEHYTYIYAAKIRAIKLFFEKYQSDVIFLDTDTLILGDVTILFEKLSIYYLMNYCHRSVGEILNYQIEESSYRAVQLNEKKKIYKLLLNGVWAEEEYIQLKKDFCQMNSGVIGIGYQNHEIINKVERLTRYLVSKTACRDVEELVFTIYFRQMGEVKEIKDSILHYYDFKHTRLFASELLGFIEEEKEIKEKYLHEVGIKDISSYELTLGELAMFDIFCTTYGKKADRDKIDLGISDLYYSEDELINRTKASRKAFRKWFRIKTMSNVKKI